jgi:acyl-coenzyme A synthetase/AMP-(fatty) acid ligase
MVAECDWIVKWSAPGLSLAMVHERHDGIVRALHRGDLQALANRAANLLAGRGVEPDNRVAVVLPPVLEPPRVGRGIEVAR